MAKSGFGLCMGCMSALKEYIVCPHCGYDNSSPYDKNYRKPGSVLASRYVIGRLIRKNGEGGMYVGYDGSLQCRVWIKEYFPYTIAKRTPDGGVLPLDGFGAQFKALMSDYVDLCGEIKRLSATEPVIPIENLVAENGTVYAVYKDIGIVSFESWLAEHGGKLPVAEAREMLLPLFNAFSNIHSRSQIHRGISPYTVYIDRDGKLYLWDFCLSAVRTGGSELAAEMFNGYSAPEQYAANGWQGTWTDVFGAAALFYRTVSGFVPPKSTLLGSQRPLAPLSDLVMDMPKNISDAIDRAMDPNPETRTQDISSLISSLVNTDLSSTAVYDASAVSHVKLARQERRRRRAENRRRGKYVALGMLITVAALVCALYVIMTTWFPELVSGDESPPSSSQLPRPSEESPSGAQESSEPAQNEKTMPNLVGLMADDVQSSPEYLERFVFNIQEDYNDQYEKGAIYKQSPSPGVVIADGRTVILYVSKGRQTLVMPDLTGMTREEVRECLTQLTQGKFDLPFTEYDKFVQGAEPGTVVSTTPAQGVEFEPQSTRINIWYMPGEASESEGESETESEGRTGILRPEE